MNDSHELIQTSKINFKIKQFIIFQLSLQSDVERSFGNFW